MHDPDLSFHNILKYGPPNKESANENLLSCLSSHVPGDYFYIF